MRCVGGKHPPESEMSDEAKSFWAHLDELKGHIVRIVAVVVVFTAVAFGFREWLFEVVLAPARGDFLTYRLIERLHLAPQSTAQGELVQLINTGLAAQFIVHLRVALYVGVLAALPYVIYSLFRFISPALYDHERRHTRRYVAGGYVMFLLGCALNYFVIFPFTFRFLAGYQVSSVVPNMISLESYISTLLGMTLVMGALFEIPVVCALLARLGVLHHSTMVGIRRYAIVISLVVAAVITPTGDPFTLMLVAVPIWMLYELGVWVVRSVERVRNK